MTRALALLVPLALAGCLFAPAIERYGYTRCDVDDDCAAGRACFAGRCSPPPWNDPGFGTRQLLVVENPGETDVPAGAAVSVRVGEGGLLETADLGADGRFTFYDWGAQAWEEVPVFRDVYDAAGFLNVWLPLRVPAPAGETVALAWLDAQSGANDPQILEAPERVFAVFDDVDVAVLDEASWTTYGTGDVLVGDGRINVADNQKLVRLDALAPPFSLTVRGRINGATCDQLYLGLVSDPGAGFEPPSAGFFVTGNLTAALEVAPTATSVPQQPSDLESIGLDTAEHRFRLDVGDGGVRFVLDGETVGEPRLSPRFAGEALYLIVDVDGACSFDLNRLFVTPLPFTHPTVTAEEKVEFELTE